jgi:hypothetical protein
MDLVLSGGEDQLLSSLQFKLPPSASYIQERRLASFYPSGASTFSPNGVRECRFAITSESWLDPATLRLNLTLRNSSGGAIALAAGGASLIRRMRVMAGGVTVEDISHYNRNAYLFQHMLQTKETVINNGIEDGQPYADDEAGHVRPLQLQPNSETVLSITPLLGIMGCKKLLPLRYCPLQLYIEFADATDALGPVGISPGRDYTVSNVKLLCGLVRLDSALESSFASLLMQNRALTISFNSVSVQSQVIPAGDQFQMSVVRAQSRINAVFVSFKGPPTFVTEGGAVINNFEPFIDEVTSFNNPSMIDGDQGFENRTLMEWYVQVGAKKFPESPATSTPETFSLLRQAIGTYDSDIRTVNITRQEYANNRMVIGVPMQTQAGVFGSGYSTRSGDLLTFSAKGLMQNYARSVGTCYIHILNEVLLEIREGGVSVLD